MSADVHSINCRQRPHRNPNIVSWLDAWESVARTNFEAGVRLMFVWPRVIFRLYE